MEEPKIHEYKKVDLKGATVIDGFPSVGFVSTIVGNYLINTLKLELIGIVDSKDFPPISLVRGSTVLNPVRIYAGKRLGEERKEQLVVFISEFQPPPKMVRPLADVMMHWCQNKGCDTIISPQGMVIEGELAEEDIGVYGIGSTERTLKLLQKYKIKPFTTGAITGVAGALLGGGKRRGFDVITLLAEATPDYPDARAAAKIIEVLDEMLLEIKIDAEPLYREAEVIEKQIKLLQKQAEPTKKPSPMYG